MRDPLEPIVDSLSAHAEVLGNLCNWNPILNTYTAKGNPKVSSTPMTVTIDHVKAVSLAHAHSSLDHALTTEDKSFFAVGSVTVFLLSRLMGSGVSVAATFAGAGVGAGNLPVASA